MGHGSGFPAHVPCRDSSSPSTVDVADVGEQSSPLLVLGERRSGACAHPLVADVGQNRYDNLFNKQDLLAADSAQAEAINHPTNKIVVQADLNYDQDRNTLTKIQGRRILQY